MSGVNGDKSRFNRVRKQKIARRLRKHAMLKMMEEQPRVPSASSEDKRKKVVA